jgi:hypothetical protein
VIITAAGGFKQNSKARTDARISVLYKADWFRFPYPGKCICIFNDVVEGCLSWSTHFSFSTI